VNCVNVSPHRALRNSGKKSFCVLLASLVSLNRHTRAPVQHDVTMMSPAHVKKKEISCA
jgi:hypothetical protein